MPNKQGRHETIDKNLAGGRCGYSRPPLPKRRKIAILLASLSGILILSAIAVFILIYQEGIDAERNARDLLSEYDQAVYVQPEELIIDTNQAMISLPGYDVIGKLSIEKIGLELPVISETSEKALKVSICYFSGALPGQKGNMVITGHNYANGAHFGKLRQLEAGDVVVYTVPDGTVYRYEVYQTLSVKPDNAAVLDIYEGEYALTLVTCESQGNRRLLIRCKLVVE